VVLHRDVTQLLSEVLRSRFTWKLVLRRGPLHEKETRLDELFQRFVSLDSELVQHTKPPSDFNSAVRSSAQFSMYSAVRESVRSLLSDTNAALGSLRNQIDFTRR
jgi:hypothetical protein